MSLVQLLREIFRHLTLRRAQGTTVPGSQRVKVLQGRQNETQLLQFRCLSIHGEQRIMVKYPERCPTGQKKYYLHQFNLEEVWKMTTTKRVSVCDPSCSHCRKQVVATTHDVLSYTGKNANQFMVIFGFLLLLLEPRSLTIHVSLRRHHFSSLALSLCGCLLSVPSFGDVVHQEDLNHAGDCFYFYLLELVVRNPVVPSQCCVVTVGLICQR